MKRQAVGFATPTVHVVTAEFRADMEWSKELKPPAEQSVRLGLCEMIVAITAPKGRIDESIGDYQTEMHNLVQKYGVAGGTWICRLRLTGTVLRRIPAIAVHIYELWSRLN